MVAAVFHKPIVLARAGGFVAVTMRTIALKLMLGL
jgi:hypothetical protein